MVIWWWLYFGLVFVVFIMVLVFLVVVVGDGEVEIGFVDCVIYYVGLVYGEGKCVLVGE